jgi:cytochrome c-type biogenesis protein CcmH
MPAFWILATSMTLVALAFVLVPLLYARRASSAPTAAQANLEALRRQRRELEADVVNGTLPADAHDEALAELVQRADADLAIPAAVSTAPAKRPWVVAVIVAVALPLIAFGTYLAVGMPAASDASLAARGGAAIGEPQILAMVESLARKVRERPDDAQGVALLARSMAALGRFKEAADAYERLAKLVPNDADVLADYADALGMAQGRTLDGKPAELVRQALALDPRHKKALALAGTAAMEAGDLSAATRYWESLARELPPGSPDEIEVREILADIRSKSGARGPALARAPAPAASAPLVIPGAPQAAGQSVSGSVTLAPQVADKVSGSETVFVFARAEGGSRMPLAVLRGSARELPLQFSLDDTMAMAPSSRLSLAEKVRIEARVSRSGNATPQPGDLVGMSGVVKPGARGVRIVVDKVLP